MQGPDAVRTLEVEGDGALAPVQQVEERGRAAARPVGSPYRLDLHDRRTGTSQQRAAQRPRPQSGQIHHEESTRVTPRACFAERMTRDTRTGRRPADPCDREPEQDGPFHQRLRIAVEQVSGDRGPDRGHGGRHRVQFEPRRHQLHVLGSGQRHRDVAIGARQQPAAAAAARVPSPPQAHQRSALAQQRKRIEPVEATPEPVDALDQRGRRPEWLVGPPGERHRTAGRPPLQRTLVHSGRVTSRASSKT